MKKFFITLSVMVLPFTAYAQSGGQQVLQDAANSLKPAFCANNLSNAIKIVEACYAKVDAKSEGSNMNQCVMEDVVVIGAIRQKQKQYLSNYMADPYAKLPFIQEENIGMRIMKHPNFMSNVAESEEAEDAGAEAATEIFSILKSDGCVDFDKLK